MEPPRDGWWGKAARSLGLGNNARGDFLRLGSGRRLEDSSVSVREEVIGFFRLDVRVLEEAKEGGGHAEQGAVLNDADEEDHDDGKLELRRRAH